MSGPVRVFVSYASPDRVFAERLVNDFKQAGAEMWWDVSGIDEGDFLTKINAALGRDDGCTERLGVAVVQLGTVCERKGDPIEPAAGYALQAKVGD